jgi:hypothetical protein
MVEKDNVEKMCQIYKSAATSGVVSLSPAAAKIACTLVHQDFYLLFVRRL